MGFWMGPLVEYKGLPPDLAEMTQTGLAAHSPGSRSQIMKVVWQLHITEQEGMSSWAEVRHRGLGSAETAKCPAATTLCRDPAPGPGPGCLGGWLPSAAVGCPNQACHLQPVFPSPLLMVSLSASLPVSPHSFSFCSFSLFVSSCISVFISSYISLFCILLFLSVSWPLCLYLWSKVWGRRDTAGSRRTLRQN